MFSVTKRITLVKQPRGGYIKPSEFREVALDSKVMLNPNENLHATTMGLVVDYLTRYMNGTNKKEAFHISLNGASLVDKMLMANELLVDIIGLDDTSIRNACKLTGFDVCFRSNPSMYKPVEHINPDKDTIENIRIMVERSLAFFDEYGPVTEDGIVFPGGYSTLVSSGDGDFLTADTIWDFKVSKAKPTNKHTLQILMYYIMGLNSIRKEEYEKLSRLGFFNPRLNTVYLLDINKITESVIQTVANEVIGYEMTEDEIKNEFSRYIQKVR